MIVTFYEKHENRLVEGPDLETICARVLKERIEDTMGYGLSVWYDEDTENAQRALDQGRAVEYLLARRSYEYEDFEVTL